MLRTTGSNHYDQLKDAGRATSDALAVALGGYHAVASTGRRTPWTAGKEIKGQGKGGRLGR